MPVRVYMEMYVYRYMLYCSLSCYFLMSVKVAGFDGVYMSMQCVM